MRFCWCGSNNLESFNSEYSCCSNCNTLVSQQGLSDDQLLVVDDDVDFYGKQYWLKHQDQDFGFPDIHARARNDLRERNLYWLKALLKFRLPPANLLEIGCAHGGFVALANLAGYSAEGMELSPWVVDFGNKTFGISVHTGPIENANLPPSSFDVIVLMDVLEHLADPKSTMKQCLALLNPDGLLLIQTPQFKKEMTYENLAESNHRFLEMLIPDEHLFLFSEDSVRRLFEDLGAEYIYFEPAFFSVYDMFFAVSRVPIQAKSEEEYSDHLLTTPNGRIVRAMLDLFESNLDLIKKMKIIEDDRAARLEQIIILTNMVKELQKN